MRRALAAAHLFPPARASASKASSPFAARERLRSTSTEGRAPKRARGGSGVRSRAGSGEGSSATDHSSAGARSHRLAHARLQSQLQRP